MKPRMFTFENRRIKTWNPLIGCLHHCIYCYARKWAKRLKRLCEYCYKFVPHLHVERLSQSKIPGGDLPVFVCDMSDLFGNWIPREWIKMVLSAAKTKSRRCGTTFLFLTKNPAGYFLFLDQFDEHTILGATIETDYVELSVRVSGAPSVRSRIYHMIQLRKARPDLKLFVSIEPILEFTNPVSFARKLEPIKPDFVFVGYDNYNNNLVEPRLEEVKELIEELEKFTEVRPKTLRKAWHER